MPSHNLTDNYCPHVYPRCVTLYFSVICCFSLDRPVAEFVSIDSATTQFSTFNFFVINLYHKQKFLQNKSLSKTTTEMLPLSSPIRVITNRYFHYQLICRLFTWLTNQKFGLWKILIWIFHNVLTFYRLQLQLQIASFVQSKIKDSSFTIVNKRNES